MLFLLCCLAAYALWSPGEDITDGRHDLGTNGIWLQHGWLGDNKWFKRNGKSTRVPEFRDEKRIAELAARLKSQGITDVFPHMCPTRQDGSLPAVDQEQTKRFLAAFSGFRVMPWVGGASGQSAWPKSAEWRAGFCRSVQELLATYPSLAGVHVNIEPCPSGDQDFLRLLEELRQAMPPGKVLSVAAYPPPTIWHRFPDVHWDEAYFRAVAARCDQMVVMMYDTALRNEKLYRDLVSRWTREALEWSGETKVLIGLATYDDADSGYHHPEVENLRNGLPGVHAGLGSGRELPPNYQGVALYCEWEMEPSEWRLFEEHFRRRQPRTPSSP